jgi:hypothetical protein
MTIIANGGRVRLKDGAQGQRPLRKREGIISISMIRFLRSDSENLSLTFDTKDQGGLIFGVVHPKPGSFFAGQIV